MPSIDQGFWQYLFNSYPGNCVDTFTNNGASPIVATKDKRDSWTAYPFVWKQDAGVGNKDSPLYAYETISEMKGGVNPDGGSALERRNFTYGYAAGHQHTSSEWWPSTIPSGSNTTATLSRTFETVTTGAGVTVPDRQVSTSLTGNTTDLNGTVASVSRATFKRTSSVCVTQPFGNPLGLTVRIEGPCVLSTPTSTSCTGTYPVTELQRDASGRITGRLKTDSNCQNREEELFGAFNDLGLPGSYIDANGYQTIISYSGNRILSAQSSAGTWSFGYDNNRLTSIRSPDGDAEVYCFRAGTTNCSGAYTDQLQWIATAPAVDGTGWTERIRFDYWPDGNIRQASFETPTEVRRIERYAYDAHKRMTVREWGAGMVKEWRAFDGADNIAAVSRSGSSPPAFCLNNPLSLDAGYSALCSQFVSDRANRLAVFDQFANDGGIRHCFDHDSSGNVTRVADACLVSDSCAVNNNLLSNCGTKTDFQTDDFDYIVSRILPDSDDGLGGRGTERRVFGALGLERLQSQGMKQNGRYVYFGRDTRGRPTSILSCTTSPASCVTTHSVAWDTATVPSGCPTMSNRVGRVAKTTDPVRETWFSYDSEGRVVRELYLPTGASSCSGSFSTIYTYTPGGKLWTIQYPHGRLVQYSYTSSGRVSSIAVQYDGVYQRTIDGIGWEPFGGLRFYSYNPPGGTETVVVSNVLGDSAADDACASAVGTNDLTGQIRALTVTRKKAGTLIMKRHYKWTGDEVVSETICYPGGSDITTTYATDNLARLTTATGTTFATSGGPVQSLAYEYDRLGNRTKVSSATQQLVVSNFSTHANWLSSQASSSSGSKVGYWFHSDGGTNVDGYVGIKSTASDSANSPGTEYVYGWGEASSTTALSGMSTVVSTLTRRQGEVGQVWNYYYDTAKRRTQKTGPLGIEAAFYWSGSQLLEDVGRMYSWNQASGTTTDEYVWLDGSPVVLVRGKLDPSTGAHLADFNSSCSREDVSAPCQAYGLVTDRLGRLVLSLDHATQVTGVGEFDPFGQVNRVMDHIESPHPYPATSSFTVYTSGVAQKTQGLSLDLRVRLNLVDLESVGSWYPISRDYLYFRDAVGNNVGTPANGSQGEKWGPWVPSTDGIVRLALETNDRNCAFVYCAQGANERAYAGFAMDGYEYRRYSSNSQPFFPLYRGLGQYYDVESDQIQNRHRQLDPGLGRYLSPEPFLQSPTYVQRMAQGGLSVPTYAYAANNPIRYVDSDGLAPGQWFPSSESAARDAMAWIDTNQFTLSNIGEVGTYIYPISSGLGPLEPSSAGYSYDPPRSLGEPYGGNLTPPSTGRACGDLHNHPGPNPPSTDDLRGYMAAARQYGLPYSGFVGAQGTWRYYRTDVARVPLVPPAAVPDVRLQNYFKNQARRWW